MKLIHLLLFTAFVGVAFGKKLECLEKEIGACSMKLNGNWTETKETDQCKMVQQAADCFEAASKTCNGEGKKAIDDLVGLGRDFCNKDSQMLKDLQTAMLCFKKPELQQNMLGVCLAEYAGDIMELANADKSKPEEIAAKLEKIICPNRENILNCGYGQIKSQCGEQEEKFTRKLIGPIDELLKESCDSASIPGISMAVVFLQLLVALFASRRMF